MEKSITLCIAVLLCLAVSLVRSQEQIFDDKTEEEISEVCIGCICEAASNCNITVGCLHGMCGPFRITKPYWQDAGSLILNKDDPSDPDAWKRCVNDSICAGQTLVAYVTRYKKDCNNDGRISCRDYAMIHHLGGFGCGTRPLDKLYERNFNDCVADVGHLG